MNSDIFEGLRKLAGTGACAIPKTHVIASAREVDSNGVVQPYYADIFKLPSGYSASDTQTSDTAEFAYTQVVSMAPVRRHKPTPTIDDIVALVKPPFVVANDARGPIRDESSIALKCGRGHIHKYFLRDLQIALGDMDRTTGASLATCPIPAGIIKKTKQARANAPLQCPSCAVKKSVTMIRELFEDALGVPFLIMQKRVTAEAGSIEYFNYALNITIACMRTRGTDKREWIGENMVLRIHSTDSPRKVKTSIYEFLHDAKLSADASARVRALAPPVRKWPEPSEEHQKRMGKELCKHAEDEQFEPDNLPLTPELAAQFLEDTQIAPWGFINNTIVNDPAMLIENCFVDEL